MVIDREKMVKALRDRLHEAFMSRYQGSAYARIARATGYADGYMQALLDAGLVGEKELLSVVGEERQRAFRTENPFSAAADAA
jgi:hypothetical protein